MLILAYANEHALAEARRRGVCVLWSTSRRKLWIKGETSGDVLDLVEIRVNCEQNSLLYLVKPRRTGACHTRGPDGRTRRSCFYRALEGDAWLVKRPSPKSVGYSPEAVFGAFLLGFLLSKAKAPRLPTWLFGAARNNQHHRCRASSSVCRVPGDVPLLGRVAAPRHEVLHGPRDEEGRVPHDARAHAHVAVLHESRRLLDGRRHLQPHQDHGQAPSTKTRHRDLLGLRERRLRIHQTHGVELP